MKQLCFIFRPASLGSLSRRMVTRQEHDPYHWLWPIPVVRARSPFVKEYSKIVFRERT